MRRTELFVQLFTDYKATVTDPNDPIAATLLWLLAEKVAGDTNDPQWAAKAQALHAVCLSALDTYFKSDQELYVEAVSSLIEADATADKTVQQAIQTISSLHRKYAGAATTLFVDAWGKIARRV